MFQDSSEVVTSLPPCVNGFMLTLEFDNFMQILRVRPEHATYKPETRVSVTLPLMYVCSCSLVMLSRSAPCCWQLIRASLHDSVAWKLNW